MSDRLKRLITKNKTLTIIVSLLIIIIIVLAIIFFTGEKPPYEQMPYVFDDFQGYPSSITLEKPKNTTLINQTIASIRTEEDSKVAVKAHYMWMCVSDNIYVSKMSMLVTALGSFNGSDGIFSDSIRYMKISFESEDKNTYADLDEPNMEVYNLAKHDFGKKPNKYVYEKEGQSYWWSEGVGYNNVSMDLALSWRFKYGSNQPQILNVSVKLGVGNLLSTREIVTSIEIYLTV